LVGEIAPDDTVMQWHVVGWGYPELHRVRNRRGTSQGNQFLSVADSEEWRGRSNVE